MKTAPVFLALALLVLASCRNQDPAMLSPYHERLQKTCDTGCCSASVRTMAEHGWKRVEDVQDCRKPNALRCMGSVHWCEDRSFPKEDLL